MREIDSRTDSAQLETGFFGHPKGLSILFFTEMWERFSYYGMRALLILFMTASTASGGLGMEVSSAGVIYGLFTAGAYLAALPGGWIADRVTGFQRAVVLGGVLIAAGNALLLLHANGTFYFGLLLVIAGTGLLKPNVSTIVGQLYQQADQRRDAGFSIFYMGINLGAFIAPILCGYVGERINWRYGFGLASVGMAIGVVQFLFGRSSLHGAGLKPGVDQTSGKAAQSKQQLIRGLAAVVAVVAFAFVAINSGWMSPKQIADVSGLLLIILVIAFFAWLFAIGSWTRIERERLIVIAALFCASALFWSVFEQAGSTLNLFAKDKTETEMYSFQVPASWYQSINGIFIVALAPVFAWIWLRLGRHEPSSPAKFVFGLIFVGAGFLVLALGAMIAQTGVRVSPIWLLATYLLHTMGELCLSPVGLSAMTKLAPVRVAGLMMGVWFLSISVGNYMGGRMAAMYDQLPLPTLLGAVGGFAVVAALLFAILIKPINRLMGDFR